MAAIKATPALSTSAGSAGLGSNGCGRAEARAGGAAGHGAPKPKFSSRMAASVKKQGRPKATVSDILIHEPLEGEVRQRFKSTMSRQSELTGDSIGLEINN